MHKKLPSAADLEVISILAVEEVFPESIDRLWVSRHHLLVQDRTPGNR